MSGAGCAVALALLLDASSSIQPAHWRAMVEGHADAIRSPGVAGVIERGDGVAVSVRAFGSTTAPMFGWRVLRTRGDADAFARALAVAERPDGLGGWTSIGAAIRDGLADLEDGPGCDERVLDVVTDGRENSAPRAEDQRDRAEAAGVRVNGVMVGHEADADWMRGHAVTQPGGAARAGFVLHAGDWGEFADAIRQKITLEIAAR